MNKELKAFIDGDGNLNENGEEVSLQRILRRQERILTILTLLVVFIIVVSILLVVYVNDANYVSYIVRTINEVCHG